MTKAVETASEAIQASGEKLFNSSRPFRPIYFILFKKPAWLIHRIIDHREKKEADPLKLSSTIAVLSPMDIHSLRGHFIHPAVSLSLEPGWIAAQKVNVYQFQGETTVSPEVVTRPHFQGRGIGTGLINLYNTHLSFLISTYPDLFDAPLAEEIIDNSGNWLKDWQSHGISSRWAKQLGFTQDPTSTYIWTRKASRG